MKKRTLVSALVLVAVVCFSQVLGIGCAGDKGPGSDNAEHSGTRLVVALASAENVEVDAFLSLCDPGPPAEFEEGLVNTYFSIEAFSEGVSTLGSAQTSILLNSYDVSCSSSEPGAVMGFVHNDIGITAWVDANGSLSYSGLLLIPAADLFTFSAIGNPALEPIYTCTITFYGENSFGYEFESNPIYVFVTITDYNNC